MTTDMWTSLSNKSFITVTFHAISPIWRFNSYVLDTIEVKDKHTGENIAKHLEEMLIDFGIGGI